MEIIIQEGDSVIKLTEEELKNVNGGGYNQAYINALAKIAISNINNIINNAKLNYNTRFPY